MSYSYEASRKRDLIAAEKTRGCLCCGEDDPEILEFHHVDRSEKLFVISSNKYKVSVLSLIAELAKCVPLCPTCHVRADRGTYTIEREDCDDINAPYVCIRPGRAGDTEPHQDCEG